MYRITVTKPVPFQNSYGSGTLESGWTCVVSEIRLSMQSVWFDLGQNIFTFAPEDIESFDIQPEVNYRQNNVIERVLTSTSPDAYYLKKGDSHKYLIPKEGVKTATMGRLYGQGFKAVFSFVLDSGVNCELPYEFIPTLRMEGRSTDTFVPGK